MKYQRLFFIYHPGTNRFLLPKIPKNADFSLKDKLYIITEDTAAQEVSSDSIIKKIKEEIGLNVIEILNLHWGSIYRKGADEFKEMNFIAFVNSDEVKQENLKYEWLHLDDFINRYTLQLAVG